jgi:signal transduction histidine kinase/ligand-binding sensor domain-containing protein
MATRHRRRLPSRRHRVPTLPAGATMKKALIPPPARVSDPRPPARRAIDATCLSPAACDAATPQSTLRAVKALPFALVIAAISVAHQAQALSPDRPLDQCSVQRWQVRDGLPSESIRALAQGSDGRLWIAALGGLAHYDGVRVVRVDAPPLLRASAGDATRILLARDGSVWLGSPRHRPLRAVGDAVDVADRRSGVEGVLAWAEDGHGRLTMASAGGRFHAYVNGRLEAQPMLRGLDGRVPTALHVDADRRIWVGTDRGLLSGVGGELAPHPAVGGAAVSAIHEDRRRVLWVAAGAELVAIDGDRVARVGASDGLPPGPISALASDRDGNVWAGSPAGLARVRQGKALLFTARHGLPDNDVTAVLVDREDTLWVGTRNGGLAQFTDRTLDTSAVPRELAGQDITTIGEDHEGALWFGTHGHGVLRWKDGRGRRFRRADGLPGDEVAAVLGVSGGAGDGGAQPLAAEVWLGTGAGLARWRAGAIDRPPVWPRPVTALYRDRHGALWIGGMAELGRLAADGTLTVFTARDGVPARQVRMIAEDHAGGLWISGLGRPPFARLAAGKFVRPEPLRERRLGPVRAMLADRRGVFWLTVGGTGLLGIGPGGGVRVVDARETLDADMLYQLLEDDAGDFWVGTTRSILRVSRAGLDARADGRRTAPEVVSFELTDHRSGVVASETKQSSALKARDGRLWFVTAQGAVTIDPRRVVSNPVPPAMAIEQVVVDGRPARLRGRDDDRATELPARPRRIELHYAARALLEPSKVRYQVRLEGADADWVDAGGRRVATYADLPPGRYHFRVRASNNDRLWNERGASLAFAIAAPFYRRPWPYLALAAALLPLGLLVHRVRVGRVRTRYAVMFAERSRVARELHDTLLQGMSGIALQLDSLRARIPQAPDGGVRRDLEDLQATVATCLDETRRVVWELRDGEGSGGDLGAALARFARRLSRSSPTTTCEVIIDGTARRLSPAAEGELYRIGQEAIRNAFKHAGAARVEVRLRYQPGTFTLTIKDDGRGFDLTGEETPGIAATSHFGLVGLRERAGRIGATLTVASRPGEGTTVEVVVPATPGPARSQPDD